MKHAQNQLKLEDILKRLTTPEKIKEKLEKR